MTDLADLVEPLKREVAVPGAFDSSFPSTSDDDLRASLEDSFAECQLDGYFSTSTLDLLTHEVTPDLSSGGRALVTIYAALRIVRAKLRELNQTERYKAGNVEYEIGRGVTMLREDLVLLTQRRDELVSMARRSGRGTHVHDSYFARASTDWTDVAFDYAEVR